jgi:large subunit ribosomal protein L4
MKAVIYDILGKEVGKTDIKDEVFKVEIKDEVIGLVVNAMRANARQPWAHSKDRSERRGGGKKPWKQKGTGRARHGSRRSPIWRKGGVTFGPRNEREYGQKVNKKVATKAMRMVLSGKVRDGEMKIVEELKFKTVKTKEAVSMFKNMGVSRSSTVVLEGVKNQEIARMIRNIPRKEFMTSDLVNVLNLLDNKYLILSHQALRKLEDRLA